MYKESFSYMGSKYKLLSQIIPLFPKNIETFYDLFCGSAVVSLNIKANKYVVNDLSKHLYNLYDMFKYKSADEIIKYIYQKREEYGFITSSNRKELKGNKESFNKCRNDVNNNPSTIGYFFLTYYSFCNQFRFNNGKFNMPLGNGYFKKDNEIEIKNLCEFFNKENVYIYNKNYSDFIDFDENSFVYLDLPYSSTEAVYNSKLELDGWTKECDYEFFKWCELLNSKGVKWAISNVFCNKGLENKHLVEWCGNNDWIVHHLSMKYAGHSRKSANQMTDEVLICNYGEEDKDIFDL